MKLGSWQLDHRGRFPFPVVQDDKVHLLRCFPSEKSIIFFLRAKQIFDIVMILVNRKNDGASLLNIL